VADFPGEGFDSGASFGEATIDSVVSQGFQVCTQLPPPSPTPPAIIEAVVDGPIEGGTILTLIGGTTDGLPNVFIDTSRDDSFTGVVIDPTKWTASTTGSGTVVQDDDLRLRSGTTVNSSAVLTSVLTFDPIVETQVSFDIITNVVGLPPAATTRFFDFELRVDASNYFRVSREFDASLPPRFRHIFRITCVMGDATVENVIVPNDTRGGILRLTRVRNRVVVRANSFVIYDGAPFDPDASVSVVFRAVNPSLTQPYDFTVALDDFVVPALILFANEPALVREVAADFIRTESPEVRTPRTVTLRVYLASGFLTELVDAFTYLLTFEFRVLSNAGTSIGFVNDRTLRNRTAGRPGLLS